MFHSFCVLQNSTYCVTKFKAQKKTTQEKKLSSGIKRFLEKQKLEEEQKIRANENKLKLLARRDPKEQKQTEKTLKVIKSTQKFFTGDEEIDKNTKLTMERNITEDYGFENKSSEAIYLRLMKQYNMMPVEDKFEKFINPKKSKNTANIKVTVKNKDENNIKTGQRQNVSKFMGENITNSSKITASSSSFKPKKCTTPPIDFKQLLKLAELKQYKDIVIELPSKKEPERLLTNKEKRELEEIEALRKARIKENAAIYKLGVIQKLNDVLVKKDKISLISLPKVQQKQQQVSLSSSKPQIHRVSTKPKSIMSSSSKMPLSMTKISNSSTTNVQTNKSQLEETSKNPQKSKELMQSREFLPKDARHLKESARDMKMKISTKRKIIIKLIFFLHNNCLGRMRRLITN